jgi:glutamate/tyrosine decarboxylase-like PLP-dependent enzyme
MNSILDDFSLKAKEYLDKIGTRNVFPSKQSIDNLKKLDVPLQDASINPKQVLHELYEIGSPATVASTGKRYFGFVIGGSLPAALAANLLAGVWDQNAGLEVASPISSFLEEVCQKWLVEILNLPSQTAVGFVTGATMANFTALAAARHALLEKAGWNVEEDGLFEAPPINVIVGEEVHASVLKALSMLGLGRKRIMRVPVDNQGRMKVELIPDVSGPTIICLQAGNVNTGAFDPVDSICKVAHDMNAWVHIDGAFGLWVNAIPNRKHLTEGIEQADSWATDAHKWLNVPYDSGIVLVRDAKHLTASMSMSASYLAEGKRRDPFYYVPELSRRARGIEIWAALRSLGKNGLRDLINRNCEYAKIFAKRLQRTSVKILNEIVLNQILVSFGDSDFTNRIIKRIQEDGTCWCGGTVWQNQTAMRISISSWKTTEKDIIESADAIIRIINEEKYH